jgi:predicted glycogen debranching enzyme
LHARPGARRNVLDRIELVTDDREWLETDGLGGFASGPVRGGRTRRYHAFLVVDEGGQRFVLVNGLEVQVETARGTWPLSTQAYVNGVVHPDGGRFIEAFTVDPWPTWRFRLPDGTVVGHEVFMRHGRPQTFLSWRVIEGGPATLRVRPLLSGRDYHALHRENPLFRFEAEREGDRWRFRPYDGVPALVLGGNGVYRPDPAWYRGFHYVEEERRGLDCIEDLASPGELTFDLGGEASLILGAQIDDRLAYARGFESERRRAFRSPLDRAADAYIVTRGQGKSIIAGYPWFTDWGRDTFIALRGLCLSTGRYDDALTILLRWAETVRAGMLPNRFPDGGGAPEYNSVDAALWFVIAVHELISARPPATADRNRLAEAVEAILTGYALGTRHDIVAGEDGLLAAGEPGVPLTWMDAKVGEWAVTPRIGKPVEIQALWLNALWIGNRLHLPSAARWMDLHVRGRASFETRFWNPATGGLFDVIDVDHLPGKTDAAFRPNQIFAVGGLPLPMLEGARARAIVDAVETRLWTPLGLRTLAPDEPGYRSSYEGGPGDRDSAYHQGTVWPWLMGPFVEAWLRVRGNSPIARKEAQRRFLHPLLFHLRDFGVGHVAEVASAAAPHRPGGCPFQAWSVGELLRIDAAAY